MRHAAGQVIAETTQVLRADVPLQKEVAVPQGEPVKRWSLELFGARLPLSWRLAPDGAYTAQGVRTSLSVYGRLLPVAVLEETLQPVSVRTQQPRTREEAEALAREELARQEAALGAGVEITAREDRVRVTDEAVTVERTLTCRGRHCLYRADRAGKRRKDAPAAQKKGLSPSSEERPFFIFIFYLY